MAACDTIGKYLSVIHALKLIEILDNLSNESSTYHKLETIKIISTNLFSISTRFNVSKMDSSIKSILNNYLNYYDFIIKQKLLNQSIDLDILNSVSNTVNPITTEPTINQQSFEAVATVPYPENVNPVINQNSSLGSNYLSEDETISDHNEYDQLNQVLVNDDPKVYIDKYCDISNKADSSIQYLSKRGRKSKKINYKF